MNTTPMPEHAVRARRNVIIGSVGICLYYLGGGEIKTDSGLGLLGIKNLDPVAIKFTVFLMFGWFLIRFAQCCIESPNEFRNSITAYIQNSHSNWLVITLHNRLKRIDTSKNYTYENQPSSCSAYEKKGPWWVAFNRNLTGNGGSDLVGQSKLELSFYDPLRLRIIVFIALTRPAFSDWIMPWFICLPAVYLLLTGQDMQQVYAVMCEWSTDCLRKDIIAQPKGN